MMPGLKPRFDALVTDGEMARILLREMQHQISNDMQLITSLATIQGRQSPNPSPQAGLEVVARRVAALAPLYEHLIPIGTHREIDFGNYVHELCRLKMLRVYLSKVAFCSPSS
jgi:two-component system, sensor histidine kinase PdtaS